MNVSHKHKIVWWAPERTASKLLTQIFKHYDFIYWDTSKKKTYPLGEPYHSHMLEIPEGCEDYKIICSIRNPYDRVLSLFLNLTSIGKNLVYTRDRKQDFIKRFDYFTKELFIYAIKEKKIQNLERDTPVREYVSKVNFEKIPDYFIRMENLKEDLQGLDFISESDIWKSGFFDETIENNQFINRRPYNFNQIYTFEGANKVYQFQKKLFFICGYDPFSFTTETLSEMDKRRFLHETF